MAFTIHLIHNIKNIFNYILIFLIFLFLYFLIFNYTLEYLYYSIINGGGTKTLATNVEMFSSTSGGKSGNSS